jgi:hypothetical protein
MTSITDPLEYYKHLNNELYRTFKQLCEEKKQDPDRLLDFAIYQYLSKFVKDTEMEDEYIAGCCVKCGRWGCPHHIQWGDLK